MAEWTIEKALLANFASSSEAYRQTDELRIKLGFAARAPIARMAVGRSLGETTIPPKVPDMLGKAIKGDTLFGVEEHALWMALLVANFRDLFPKLPITLPALQDLVARHWHRGVNLLSEDWEEAGGYSKFVDILITRRATLPEEVQSVTSTDSEGRCGTDGWAGPESVAKPVTIELGREETSDNNFVWTVNGVGYSPHIAVMGQAGSGKTRTMIEMLKQVHARTGAPILLLDLGKGDLADNAELARELDARVLRVPQDQIPMDMFHGSSRSETDASDAVLGFRDSLAKVMQSRPGAMQLEHIREALKPLFARNERISLEDVRDGLKDYYDENTLKVDSVISAVNDLTERSIFNPELSPAAFFSKSWIITFAHARDTVKNLAAYMLLDSLNAYMKRLDEAPQDDRGHRAIRMVLAVDEARHLLASRHKALSDNIRLHRSKGLVVSLASQSPDDYDGAGDDYLENIGLPICFKTNAASTMVLQNMFRGKISFAGLGAGICMTLKDGKPIRVKAF